MVRTKNAPLKTSKVRALLAKPLRAIELLSVAVIFILPLKFASLAALPEAPLFYPDNPFAWLIVSWPNVLFYMFSGFLLLAVTILLPPGKFRKTPSLIFAALWIILAPVALIGMINASSYEYVIYQVTHIFGIACFIMAVYRLLDNNPSLKNIYIGALVFGTFFSCFDGVYQLTTGFEETKNYVYQQESASAVKAIEGNFKQRLEENRVFAAFSLCNSFAAHLILMIPLCFWALWTFCGRVDPPRTTRMVFIPPFMLLMLALLYLTGSRAAMLSFIAAAAATFLFAAPNKKIRNCILLSLPLLALGALLFIYYFKGFASVSVRIDYYASAFKMFLNHPFAGTGWGDFFHEYMKLKTTISDEAPHTPHSILMDFASQAGTIGLVAALMALFYPVYALLRKLMDDAKLKNYITLNNAVFMGFFAWVLHSLTDINLQVPATVCSAVILLIIAGQTEEKMQEEKQIPFQKHKSSKIFPLVMIIAGISLSIPTIANSDKLFRHELAFHNLQTLCDLKFKTKEDLAKISVSDVREQLKECAEIAPWSAFIWAAAADFMMYKNLPFAAEDYYKEASKRSPERPSFYYRLYLVQTYLGKKQEAEANYQKALERFPNNPKYQRQQPQIRQF